nr:PREDICTED: T-cell receptor-associated transmembrane adapter 1 [Latimeria chalumnae]|eukprot:XP_006011152.2 PREDICTED: T-cell receptor-associated transmembrane adapter 1 [Latimeria chalumnae]
MNASATRYGNELQAVGVSQMCYASLDLCVEKKGRNAGTRTAQRDLLNVDTDMRLPSKTNTLASRNSIYLNSDQLIAQNQIAEESIHEDPVKLYTLINANRYKTASTDDIHDPNI